jgi:hypothetical protein
LEGQQRESHSVDNTAIMSTEYDNLSSDLIWEIARKLYLPHNPRHHPNVEAESRGMC